MIFPVSPVFELQSYSQQRFLAYDSFDEAQIRPPKVVKAVQPQLDPFKNGSSMIIRCIDSDWRFDVSGRCLPN